MNPSHPTPSHDTTVPRVPLMAVGALLLATVAAVALVQFSGQGAVRVPDAAAVSVRSFTFEDRRDGGIDVRHAETGALAHQVAPESNGFLRGTMRGLARERKRLGVGPEQPFELIGRADGRLTLRDPATGRRVDLDAFGPQNAAVFASLMTPR